VNAGSALVKADPVRANGWLLKALRMLPTAQMPDGSPVPVPHDLHLESLVWSNACGISTPAHLRNWIETVEQFTPSQRAHIFTDELANAACMSLADMVRLHEAAKSADEQQWDVVLKALSDLANWALHLHQEVLWACAVRAQIVVFGEYVADLDAASRAADDALRVASPDPRVQFLIRDIIGRQFIFKKRRDEGLVQLREALAQKVDVYPLVRMNTLLYACEATSPKDREVAMELAQEAVKLGRASDEIPETELVKALGELAIAKWQVQGLPGTLATWDEAVRRLLHAKSDSNNWKGLFIICGHVLGYMSSLTRDGRPPPTTTEGEVSAGVEQGMFLQNNERLATRYSEVRSDLLPVMMALFAERVGDDDMASEWAMQILEQRKEARKPVAMAGVTLQVLPSLLRGHQYGAAIDMLMEFPLAVTIGIAEESAGRDPFAVSTQLTAQAAQDNELRRKAEHFAATFGLVPMAFHVGSQMVLDRVEGKEQAADVAVICRQTADRQRHRRRHQPRP